MVELVKTHDDILEVFKKFYYEIKIEFFTSIKDLWTNNALKFMQPIFNTQ